MPNIYTASTIPEDYGKMCRFDGLFTAIYQRNKGLHQSRSENVADSTTPRSQEDLQAQNRRTSHDWKRWLNETVFDGKEGMGDPDDPRDAWPDEESASMEDESEDDEEDKEGKVDGENKVKVDEGYENEEGEEGEGSEDSMCKEKMYINSALSTST